MTGSTREMDLDGFLGHQTRGPAANFLDGWKKRNPPLVNVVLHTRAPIIAVWQHNWPRIVTREKDGKEVREVWSGQYNSWETEEILKNQYKRDDSGMREYPPVICPMSIMLEEVNRLYEDGTLTFDQVMFQFAGDDPTKGKKLHVGGMLNRMKEIWKGLSDEEKRAAKKNGVPGPADAWTENLLAKCSYVFTVVDYDHIDDGVQIAKETTLVGDKMKKCIRDRMLSEGEDKGHPFKNPYVFQWTYKENATSFNDKYDVVPIGKLAISEALRDLIVKKAPPDISRYVAKGDIVALRASMEDAYCGPANLLDFDFIFAKAEALLAQENPGSGSSSDEEESGETAGDIADDIVGTAAEDEPEAAPAAAATPAPAAAAPAKRGVRKAAEPAPDPKYVIASKSTDEAGEHSFAADGMELFACDVETCRTIMRADEASCRKCGATYEIGDAADEETTPEDDEPEEAPPPPPPKPAARAQAAATKPAASTTAPKAAPAAAKPVAAAGKPAAAAAATAGAAAKATGKDRLGF